MIASLLQLTILFLFVSLIFNYLYISIKNEKRGSDHYAHKLIIDLIKQNGNRFINDIKTFLFGNMMGYPQLYHWILSYFTESQLKFIIRYQNILINLTSLFIHCAFSFYLAATLEIDGNPFQILFYSLLMFLSSGFLFDGQNARNTGLSARSIGFITGQIFMYCCYFYFNGNYYFVFSFPLLMLFSLLMSQFTTQFIIIASVILSLLFMDYLFFLVNILGILLFIILFPVTSKNYLIFQWKHKKYYAKYGTKLILLPMRKSIWGDFIHIGRYVKQRGVQRTLLYMYYNPIVKILTGVPVMMFIFYFMILQLHYETYFFDSNLVVLLKIIAVTFLVFMLTSFKYTRFLGEPERYVEFAISMACAVTAIRFFDQPLFVFLIVMLGLPRLITECYLMPYLMKRYTKNGVVYDVGVAVESLRKEIENGESETRPIRILSNEFDVLKFFLDTKWECFYGWTFFLADYFDPYVLFKDYGVLSEDIIPFFIKKYSITHVIIDTRSYEGNVQEKLHYQKQVWTDGRLELYLV